MAEVYGEGDFLYKHVDNWAKLPDGAAVGFCATGSMCLAPTSALDYPCIGLVPSTGHLA